MTSSFISKGLKYENIQSEAKSIHENLINEYLFNNYDFIILKLPKSITLSTKIISKINNLSFKKTIYLLVHSDHLINIDKKILPTKNVYPYNVPIRYLAHEIKKIGYKIKPLNEKVLKIYDLKLDLNTRLATRYSKSYYLRNKEFQLLEYLMRNVDGLLSRQMILENVWDRNAHLMTNTVDVHINCIRKKVDHKAESKLIETVHCNGYILHSKPFCNN